ncbi:ABC transporter ATP-binding protein [Desulfurobacterium sp. TC5-1]|uniref:metal ABC transporter ATP-binding protein n=1 Tax=Desulfurobacterium sp. TC5-1 TaxID=1158318 RepID=UPI0003B623C5|nr:ABC transporter ATP-binding protein [Desulfurobacterium sp. TC5-1]
MKNHGIELKNLTVGYNIKKPLIKGLSLFMDEGEFWVVVGPNGAGKSTLLKTILGIVPPLDGEIYIHGVNCTDTGYCEEKQFLSYVPQMESYSKIFPATAFDIVVSGLFPRKGHFEPVTKKDKELALHWLRTLELDHLADKPFSKLSGGQQRKILIARALVGNPHYLFLDEPTTGVDIKSSRKILNIIASLNKNKKFGILMVTHDLNFVWPYIEKVIIVGNGKFVAGKKEKIINERVLSEIYGVNVKIIETPGGPIFLIGDKHY